VTEVPEPAEQKPQVWAHLYFIVFAYFADLQTRFDVSHHFGVRSRHESASVVIAVGLGVTFSAIDTGVAHRPHVFGHNR